MWTVIIINQINTESLSDKIVFRVYLCHAANKTVRANYIRMERLSSKPTQVS
jgi:hypothetical protein